jgi:hypothetical protein
MGYIWDYSCSFYKLKLQELVNIRVFFTKAFILDCRKRCNIIKSDGKQKQELM